MKRAQSSFEFSGDFGRRLRALRERAGLTQEQLARLMGRTGSGARAQISQLETGRPAHPTMALTGISDFRIRISGTLYAFRPGLGAFNVEVQQSGRRPLAVSCSRDTSSAGY